MQGDTPLHIAVHKADIRKVELLLEHANVNALNNQVSMRSTVQWI